MTYLLCVVVNLDGVPFMLDRVLISDRLLALCDDDEGIRSACGERLRSSGLSDGACERALRRYLLLTEFPERIAERQPVCHESVVYSRYYWFTLFAKLCRTRQGHDAGLEQQAFQILENADCEVDWNVIRAIEIRVEEDVLRE